MSNTTTLPPGYYRLWPRKQRDTELLETANSKLELENSILSAELANVKGKNDYLIGELQICSEKFAHHGLNLSAFLTNEAIKVGRKL